MTIDIDLSEVVAVAALLDGSPKQAEKVTHAAGVAALRTMKSGAVAAVSRDSGWTAQKGIRTKSWQGHYDLYTADDENGENPGFHLEYGTSTQPPQPFIQPQLEPGAEMMAQLIVAGVDPLAAS